LRALGRSSAARSVELLAVLLILLAVYLSVAAASSLSSTESTGQGVSGSVPADSPTNDPPHHWHHHWNNYWWYYPYYYNYYWSEYPYYYYETAPAETTKTFELKVETNPSGIAPVNGNGTYNDGTVASFSVTSLIVPVSANQRYVFSSWSGDFSGVQPGGTVTMNAAKTVVANYQLQNYLVISVEPQGIASAAGEGWYDLTDSVTVGPVPSSISGGEGARYVFQQWTVDAAPVSGNSVQVKMDAPHTVVGHYKTQYLLTVSSDYGIVQGGGWYDAGSSATFSVTTEVDTSYGVKQLFERWTGDTQTTSATTTIMMDSPHTVRAVWRTDSTILYATIALGIGAAFVLGIALAIFAIRGLGEAKSASPPSPKPVATTEPVPEKVETTRTKKKAKPPPDTEPSSQT
jgi:hypothetical protein